MTVVGTSRRARVALPKLRGRKLVKSASLESDVESLELLQDLLFAK